MNEAAKVFFERIQLDLRRGCWIWLGWLSRQDYGRIRVDGKIVHAHRFAWRLLRGAVPEGLLVLHRCDVRTCVNPGHLFLGDAGDNARDCVSKGRNPSHRGENNAAAKLSTEDVIKIRAFRAAGRTHQSIARDFGVGETTVRDITSGRKWAYLEAALGKESAQAPE